MRLMGKGGQLEKAVLFSDNIVAVQHGTDLQLLKVFEVKSGYIGGREAQGQIFKWIEGRITDGSQIIIPRGARIFAEEGSEVIRKSELRFTYKPNKAGVPSVVGLMNADRHLITAGGISHLGIDSPEQVAAHVVRHELSNTSEELDYLVAETFRSVKFRGLD